MEGPTPTPPAEPRQRWRIAFARAADPARRTHRELADAWLAALVATGLPLAGGGRGRQPLSFGLPLPAGIAAEHELADVVLVERLRRHLVRAAVARSLPDGIEVLDLHDVWLGAPAISAAVVAADYRVALAEPAPSADLLIPAIDRLLAADSVPVERQRSGGAVTVDIRPLVGDVRLAEALWIRGLVHPERGAGRPEDVLAVLAADLGMSIEPAAVVRERVVVADEPASGPPEVDGRRHSGARRV